MKEVIAEVTEKNLIVVEAANEVNMMMEMKILLVVIVDIIRKKW